MGYLFLFISVFAGATKGFCGKKVSGFVESYRDTMLCNFLRMFFCIIIGLGMIAFDGDIGLLAINPNMLLTTFISGVSTAAFVILWIISVKDGSYVVLDVFLMLGVIFTTVLCKIFFNEAIKLNQYIGFAILVGATLVMCWYNISSRGRMSLKSLLLLIGCGVANGITDFSQKMFVYGNFSSTNAVFNFYTYVFAALTLAIAYMCFKDKNESTNHNVSFVKNIIGYIIVMAVCLFANSFFKVLAAGYLDSAKLYPLTQGSALILSALMAGVFFKEKITIKCIAGMLMAFTALIIINIL